MDIRIGNDIRLNVAISDFEILPEESIKCAHCFLMSEAEKNLSNVDPKSIALPTKYTLRHSRGRIYNVLPINAQVRPHCGGPGFFGKSLRQYGKPIFTRVVENIEPEDPTDTGWIYGYFQEFEQKITGDYYLAVMLVLENDKYGARSKRHIVIDYGYVFTLTMDGDVCPAEGIYVSKQKDKLPNTITWTVDPSSRQYNIGDIVTFAAEAVSGDVIFNKTSPVVFTGDGMVITATSANTERYIGQTSTKVLRAVQKTNNTIIWDVDPSQGLHHIGDVVQFSAHAENEATITFKVGNNEISVTESEGVYSGSITISSLSTVLKATSAETQTHKSATSSKTIIATEQTISNIYALSRNSSAPAPTVIGDITSPDELYTRTGTFADEDVIDCSDVNGENGKFKMAWFAIPKAKTLRIEDADSHDDQTMDYTSTIIGDYKVYYKTELVSDWTQLRLGLKIS